MDLTPTRVISHLLRHHGIPMVVAGELVLNYYNVPRVCHVRHLPFYAFVQLN